MHISHDLIKLKAIDFATKMELDNPPKFSNGWMQKFLKRHGFKKYNVHGESGAVNLQMLQAAIPSIQIQISQFSPQNVYNMDETGLFFTKPPSSTISRKPIEGQKMDKKRITVAITSNADGSDKLPLFFIGKSKKPRCFNKKTGAELGFHYEHNPKAWMTTSLFLTWVEDFNYPVVSRSKRVLLLLDNAPTHKQLLMSNVLLVFPPPNTTSKIQPMDAGIIANFKRNYKKLYLRRALTLTNPPQDMYKVDQLSAMKC